MKIIELTEIQFKNYSKMHSLRNYFQTVEYANVKKNYTRHFFGFINENNNTLMGAALILEKSIGKFKIGCVPGGFLIDYVNSNLFKDFIMTLKSFLKEKKYVYLSVENRAIYKMFNKNKEVIYFDTNIIKELDELSFVKNDKKVVREVVLESEKTPNETYKMFNLNTKRNIKLSLQRAITIYKDENTNPDTLFNLNKNINQSYVKDLISNFNNSNVSVEIYIAKLNPEQYINNYRFLLKNEEERNYKLNEIMQNVNIKKTNEMINKKMTSDRLITKYNNEIIKATNIYSKYHEETVVGAIMIVKNNREIYFLDEGCNKDFEKLYSSHLIKWEIIKKYLTEGYKIFNFGKIANMEKTNGDYNFKMGFGGKIYEYIGNYDLIINEINKIFLYYGE